MRLRQPKSGRRRGASWMTSPSGCRRPPTSCTDRRLTLGREAAYTARSAFLPGAHNRGRRRMARIKHIALITDDPAKTAEFYKENFGLTELYRRPTDTGAKGVWLSDGYIYFAILKYGTGD